MGRAGESSVNRKTLFEEWFTFASSVIPERAPDIQRTEMRRAWYAGAAALFALITEGLDPEAEPTDADVAYMENLKVELEKFALDIAGGRA
jgi:hypothetical protein